MPSSQFVLAYHSRTPLSIDSIPARLRVAEEYAESLHRKPCVIQESATGPHTGVAVWKPCDETIGWPQFKNEGDETVAWVGIPEHDAMSSQRLDALDAARAAIQPGFDIDSYGAPYACIYRVRDELCIINDSLGLARLYEFEFDDLTVWSSRPGLAHIFAAERVYKNDVTWSGMATLGWNVGGQSHIGSGTQLPGSRVITASGSKPVIREDRYAEWVRRAASKGTSWEDASEGMVRTMSLGHYFDRAPVADLSGGKDSRLLAAAALASGVTETVRTVRSDHGEVETAEQLAEIYPGTITHLVTEVAAPKDMSVHQDFTSHVAATIIGTEGATVPSTALRGPAFRGYSPFVVARFNGHGGEALHGGEYCRGSWAKKLVNQGLSGAIDRMAAMVSVTRTTSSSAREQTMNTVRARLETGLSMGIDTAYGLLNYFYSAERMPFWASSSPNRSTITPYYSSGLLHHIGRTFVGETDFESFYKEILSSLIPEWTKVPFYRPAGVARRASRFFWQNFDWQELRTYALDNAGATDNFDAAGIENLVEQIDDGAGTKNIESPFSRFIWEVSLDSAVNDINERVAKVRTEIGAGRAFA